MVMDLKRGNLLRLEVVSGKPSLIAGMDCQNSYSLIVKYITNLN